MIVYKDGWAEMLPESWISEKRNKDGLPTYQVDLGFTETEGYWFCVETLGEGEPEYSTNYKTKEKAIKEAKKWMEDHKKQNE